MTPLQAGFHMPAEWSEHEATWLSWPKNPLTFPEDIIEAVESTFCQMIAALQGGEKVKVLVDNAEHEESARNKLSKSGVSDKNVIFQHIKSADVWMRDYGPTFLLNKKGEKACVKWTFNAWGEKYDDLMPDNETGEQIVRASGVQAFTPGIVMEGGSIDVNGKGTLLTTEQCLLNKNRNPKLSKNQIENYLKDYLGVSNIIWLKEGIAGDDTDGHVDDFARFVRENTVVCAFEENSSDENHAVLKKNFEQLKASVDQDGNNLKVLNLPMPGKIFDAERRLPASYANFYIGNKAVLVPVFGHENDEKAVRIMQEIFPEREIIYIHSKELVYGYGGIHCVTQQEPKSGK